MGVWRAYNGFVKIVHISQKMFTMVVLNRLARDVRFESVGGIREGKVFKTALGGGDAAARKGEQEGENKG
jgi:hypothetical protein